MGTLSIRLQSLPISMSICSEIVIIIGWKIYRLDEPAKKTELREPCIKAGAFRKAFVLDVRHKGMGVPMNEHSLAPLHPFKSLR